MTKTSELVGPALDLAVAKVEGVKLNEHVCYTPYVVMGQEVIRSYKPSSRWSQGGPIIEREKLQLHYKSQPDMGGNMWIASERTSHYKTRRVGPTPLIAAMRCYVASKLGDEVEIPKELL